MNVVPVIARELRIAGRHPFSYWLRLLGVAAVVVGCVVFAFTHGFQPSLGSQLFAHLHFALFAAIWIFVPFLTADCISGERREGTLGLLFLTPLKAGDIVVAKGVAHGLRALTLWLAVLPVLTLPFLLGGASGTEVFLSTTLNFAALCWSLGAGLLASTLSRVWSRAVVYAAFLSVLLCLGFAVLYATITIASLYPANWLPRLLGGGLDRLIGEGVWLVTDLGGAWNRLLGSSARARGVTWLWTSAGASLLSLLGLLLVIRLAARRVRQVWQEEPASARILWLEKSFCTPLFFRGLFRAWMQHKLERNPVGWLEQRTWSGRLVTWGWLGLVTCLYCAAFTGNHWIPAAVDMHQLVGALLGGSLALTAAGSFRRERETGVLELLLVSPVGEAAIIGGRLRGLWAQFLPSIALLVTVWFYLASLFTLSGASYGEAEQWPVMYFYASAFVSVPVIGLYYSLSCRTFITAFLATLGVGLFLPGVLAGFVGWLLWVRSANGFAPGSSYEWSMRPSGGAALCLLGLAATCCNRLYNRLQRRAFPLERMGR